MKTVRSLLLVLALVIVVSLLMTTIFFNLTKISPNIPSPTPLSPIVQANTSHLEVYSPINTIYKPGIIQLNATANNSTLKIVYALDGKRNPVDGKMNSTLSSGDHITVSPGQHLITFYSVDNASVIVDQKTVTFSVVYAMSTPVPLPTRAQAISYFAYQGLAIQEINNITVYEQEDNGHPIIDKTLASLGVETVADYATKYNSTSVYEFVVNSQWSFFFVYYPGSNYMFGTYTRD
jgi:hypothetical protein